MQRHRYHMSFPAENYEQLSSDEAFFTLRDESGQTCKIRFHDYDKLYELPGLYEQLFYDRLKCKSPEKVVGILKHAMQAEPWLFNELRVLDLGAGNGIVAEELQKHGVSRIVGSDILKAARAAALRDRPGLYDAYYDLDLTKPTTEQRELLQTWNFNCLVTVAALGFGDIPVRAFWEAFNLIEDDGWVAFNIKETFLDADDTSGFSVFIKNLILKSYMSLYHMERYRHRLSIDGKPLFYYGVAARKTKPIPESMIPPA